MNCVLFAKMDQVFSLKNKTLKNTGKMEKDTGKVREFCQSGKMAVVKSSYGVSPYKGRQPGWPSSGKGLMALMHINVFGA